MRRDLSAAQGLGLIVAVLAAGVGGAIVARDTGRATPVTTVARAATATVVTRVPSAHRTHSRPATKTKAPSGGVPDVEVGAWLTRRSALRAQISALYARGAVGVLAQPLDGQASFEGGTLHTGAGWSTMKIPVILARAGLAQRRGEELATIRDRVTRAITASDNAAAQSLFDDLATSAGGVVGGSTLVAQVLRAAGDRTTTVNTAKPPGGFSTFGQTQWSLAAGDRFFGALARRCLAPRGRDGWIVGLMREIEPDQRWGLGAGASSGVKSIAFKGGWGPGADGRYLVRQFGIVDAGGGRRVVVGLMARAVDGTFGAGVSLIGDLATVVRRHLHADRVGRASACD